MKKRWLSLLLVFAMLLSMFPVTVFAATKDPKKMSIDEKLALLENPFKDVSESDWCYDAVQYVRINEIFNGTTPTTFEFNGTLTRGMFVTVLGRMAGVDVENYKGESSFSDVPERKYYAPYVEWAVKHGITNGTSEDTFSPNALINRQQMAAFFVRYFEAFDVDYETDANITTVPADLDSISDYAKDAALKLWKQGLLNGDGTNFNPVGKASRGQAATLCMRTDKAVDVWYKEPGEPSDRIRIDPKDLEVKESPLRTVSFYDGNRLIDRKVAHAGFGLTGLPDVEKHSKPGAVLLGYYLDEEFTEPFYADKAVTQDTVVYVKYQEMDSQEVLNLTTFTQMDQDPSLSFRIQRVSGSIAPEQAATLVTKDGSDPVAIRVSATEDEGIYTVYAPAGFHKGCTYELTLAEGWIFEGKADTIRTASFSIKMEEVENLRMSEDIVYILDTDQMNYTVNYKIGGSTASQTLPVLEADSFEIAGADSGTISGRFTYDGNEEISEGDLLCIYVGLHPNKRIARSNDDDPTNDAALMDPAVYVKATNVSGDTVTFGLLDEEDQQKLYEVPDLFPFLVGELPTDSGSLKVNIRTLDISMYETALGREEGVLRKAKEKIDEGDFVVFYTQLDESGEASKVQYGRVTAYDSESGLITYELCTAEDLKNSMDLYSVVDIQGYDLVTEEQKQQLEQTLYQQVSDSGFAEEAAYLLSDIVTKTDNFRDNLTIQEMLLTDSEGNVLSDADIQRMNIGGSMALTDDVKLSVELINKGEKLHFNNGVQLAIGVDASFEVEAEDGKVAIDLSASFVQEAMVSPSVKGGLTYKKVLGINWPNGVQVNATVDVKSYTALSFAAEIYTVAAEDEELWSKMQALTKNPASVLGLSGIPADLAAGLETVSDVMDKIDELQNAVDRGTLAADKAKAYTKDIDALWKVLENNNLASREEWKTLGEALGKTSITSDLMDMMDISAETGLSDEYYDSLEALLDKYSDTVTKETDWIKLLEEQMFAMEVCVCGICIGVDASFVVRADMSIAIGSNLEYEVGKRYSFWFKIGLYTPTAGSETTDLIDEKFAFQFYVMGRLGVKAGVKVMMYAGIGTKTLASVGISAELGPYIKLWGFFIYEYEKYRPKNTQDWTYNERMMGGLLMEFGLYFMLSFEAQALGLFEYSYDFLDEEIPLLSSGVERYYYDFAYEAATDELVVINDENGDSRDGITMRLPDSVRALSYMELRTGRRGSEALPYNKYKMTVSNPYFSISDDGVVTVTPPDNMRYLECDLTITYLQGKMAYSNYDMVVTVPLVWTNLALSELKEYYTVSVEVGNDSYGYDTVWSKKVLKSQPFDLPSTEEIKEMIGWSDVKYTMGSGYGGQSLTDLTVVENTSYQFNINYPTYRLTVTGIQNPDGTTRSETFTAEYGKAFDFSSLKNTGTAKADVAYTKFANVTTEATILVNGKAQVIDLTQPINAKVAAELKNGVTAKANYVDDSIKAIFSFSGILHDEDTDIVKNNEVTQIMKKGTVPSTANVVKAVEEFPGDEGIVIASITPAISAITHTTNYSVTCVRPSGERNMVHFNLQQGKYLNGEGATEIDPMNKLVGSLLVNLPDAPEVFRTGYTFDGWFTEPKDEKSNLFDGYYGANNSENALTQTVPARQFEEQPEEEESVPAEIPYTLYAQWTPKTYTVTFNLNGGNKLVMNDSEGAEVVANGSSWKATVAQDHAFGTYYAHTPNAKDLKGMSESQMFEGLPTAYSSVTRTDPDAQRDDKGNAMNVGVSFSGWYLDKNKNGVLEESEVAAGEVTDEKIFDLAEDVTLIARWRTKVAIPHKVFTFAEKVVTYDGNGYAPERTYHPGQGSYYYLDNPSEILKRDYPAEDDGYTFDYKFNSGLHEYVRKGTLPRVAGLYDVRVEREADDDFAKMSWYNPYRAVLKINKIASSLKGDLSVSTHGRAAIPNFNISSFVGDGALEYRVDDGDWSSIGVFYDLAPGNHTMEVRLGEGMNYAATSVVDSVSFRIESGNTSNIRYEVVIKTEDKGSTGGTDAKIYAAVGGASVHLDKSGYNDFEQGAEDSYAITVPADYDMSDGKIKVNIRLDQAGEGALDGWHWQMRWIRLDVYDGSTRIYSSAQLDGTEYDNDEESHDYTFSGVGRGLNGNVYGLNKSGSTISITNGLTITDNYKKSPYDPYTYPNAPRFVAYFSNPIFNKYLTRVDLYTYRVDEVGLEAAMEEYRIENLVLNYGIDFDTSKGIMGAADYMQKETYHYELIL